MAALLYFRLQIASRSVRTLMMPVDRQTVILWTANRSTEELRRSTKALLKWLGQSTSTILQAHWTYTNFRNRLDSSLHVDGAKFNSGVRSLISVMAGEIERGTFRIKG
jgi:hypothetical protein